MTVSNFRVVARVEPTAEAKMAKQKKEVLDFTRQMMVQFNMRATKIGPKNDVIRKTLYVAAQWTYFVTYMETSYKDKGMKEFAEKLLFMSQTEFHALMWDIHRAFDLWFSRGEINVELMAFTFDLIHNSTNPCSKLYSVLFSESED